MSMKKTAALIAALGALVAAPALAADNPCGPSRYKVKELKLLIQHSSDNESSFQDPNTLEPKLLNYSAVLKGMRYVGAREGYVPFHVTVGDHTIPGPFYQASAEVEQFGTPGVGDIVAYNSMGLIANGMGNHEFDGGIDDFSNMLANARYPFVAVNLDFTNAQVSPGTPEIEIGEDRSRARTQRGKVVRSTVVKVANHCIGLIGRAPADFFNVIKDPDTTIPGIDFVGGRDELNQPLVSAVDQVLEEVDALSAAGVDKIFLLDHAQDFTGDPLSARLLRDIDVIIAAGSTGFMARPQADGPFNFLRPEDTPSADYPTVREDSEGKNILVINSDQQYRYVGNLMVTFDENGEIKEIDERSGPIATTEEAIELLTEEIGLRRDLTPFRGVQNVFDKLQETDTIQNAFKVVGTTTAPLNGNRADVRSRETNLGRLASDSTLWFTRQQFPGIEIDFALKNGGGIRDTILGPNITRLTIGAALAFDNQLAVIELTDEQLLATMENAVSRVPALDGRFPQIAGMYLEYDASFAGVQGQEELSEASRVRTLRITRTNGNVETLVDNGVFTSVPGRTWVVATNDFLSTGGDGYAALAAATKLEVTEIGEQLILEQYITDELGGTVDLPEPLADPRVVRLDQ